MIFLPSPDYKLPGALICKPLYHKALTISGAEEFQGSDRCHITRELTKDQILEKIAASGRLFWHEGDRTPVP